MPSLDFRDRSKLHRRTFLKRGLVGACAAGGLGAACASYSAWNRASAARFPSIILITLDTTRADHLGCYGYARPTSPCIDRLAREALVYDKAVSPATWTLPSHASLFTGKFPTSHGVSKAADGALELVVPDYGPDPWNHYRARPLAANEPTLATLLRQAGYATSAVVAGPWMKKVFGLNRGFDLYDDENITTVNGRLAEEVTDRALEALAQPTRQPRFLFVNYFDAHHPYQPPEEFSNRLASFEAKTVGANGGPVEIHPTVDSYDGEIFYMDFHVGRLFDGLRKLRLYDDAWIVVTSDHGELLGEHNAFGHPGFVFQEAVHVPLIVKAPGSDGPVGRVDGWVQLLDVFPMLLQAAHIEPPPGIQGNVPPAVEHPIIIESRTLAGVNPTGDWFAIIDDDWKYSFNSDGHQMLFNLANDPKEQVNLFVSDPDRARRMGDALHGYLAGLPEPPPQTAAPVDRQTHAKLRSLGYVQ